MSKSSSRATPPCVYKGNQISAVWAKLFLDIIDGPGSEMSSVIVSLGGFSEADDIQECEPIRRELDSCLTRKARYPSETVAFTIFPERIWKIAKHDRARLFSLYRRAYPKYVAMNRKDNRRGMYFSRLTMFRDTSSCKESFNGNQLEWIISKYTSRKGVRDSMLQASVFDPNRDHVADARLQFPCLQHINFVPTKDGLVLNAFYATQYVFEKAYGNYLGLAHLGRFMAHELGMNLARLNVTIGVAKLGQVRKSDPAIVPLLEVCRATVTDPSGMTSIQ